MIELEKANTVAVTLQIEKKLLEHLKEYGVTPDQFFNDLLTRVADVRLCRCSKCGHVHIIHKFFQLPPVL